MPNPTLLERVEAASGPDREIDADLRGLRAAMLTASRKEKPDV